MHETKGNDTLIKLFTRGCHHWNISVVQIVQNAFFEGLRTSRINTHYLVLFKNPADKLHPCIIAIIAYCKFHVVKSSPVSSWWVLTI